MDESLVATRKEIDDPRAKGTSGRDNYKPIERQRRDTHATQREGDSRGKVRRRERGYEREKKKRMTNACRRCSVDTGERDFDSFHARRPCCVFVAFGK